MRIATDRMPGASTVVEVHADPGGGRVRCLLRGGALSPRLLRADRAGARVALVATRALLLAGDEVRIDVRVGPGVCLEMVETSGTVAYDADGRASSWTVRASVDQGGVLLWEGLPFVASTGADVDRSTSVELAGDAVLCLREVIVLGRQGEAGGRIRLRTRVDLADAPLVVEEVVWGEDDSRIAVRGPHRVMDSVLLAGIRPAAGAEAEAEDGDGTGAADPRVPGPVVLDLDGPGALARALTAQAHDSGVGLLWRDWSAQAKGTGALARVAAPVAPAPASVTPAPARAPAPGVPSPALATVRLR